MVERVQAELRISFGDDHNEQSIHDLEQRLNRFILHSPDTEADAMMLPLQAHSH